MLIIQVVMKVKNAILIMIAIQMALNLAKKNITIHLRLQVENLIVQMFIRKVSLIGTKSQN